MPEKGVVTQVSFNAYACRGKNAILKFIVTMFGNEGKFITTLFIL